MDIKDNIFKLFIKDSEREFHVREIARALHKSPTTISKYLKQYEKQGLLASEKKLNHLIFKASNNQEFKQIKLNYNLKIIKESGLTDFLIEEYSPEAIILFGSFAKAENTQKSDIDLLIISSKKSHQNLNKFENKLNHKIQAFIHSKDEINKLSKSNKELVNSWINGIKIYGFFEVFK